MNEILEQKADHLSLEYKTKYSEDRTLKEMLSRPQDFVEGAIEGIINLLRQKAWRDGYVTGAKQETDLLSKHILELQADKGRLTDRVKELETENEQIKNSDTLCKLIGEQKRKITELEVQIEKMKCCGNCTKGNCVNIGQKGNACAHWTSNELRR